MNEQSKPDVPDLPEEDIRDRSARVPDVSRDDEPGSRADNSVVDEEPGPYDDDGLPENARRRVPS